MTVGGDIEEDTDAGRCIGTPGFERLPERLACTRRGQRGRQATADAEVVRRWTGEAGPRRMVVAAAGKADPGAAAQRILRQPLEDAPSGANLDQRDQVVVEELDQVGVPAADVRDQQHVLTASKLLVQPGNGMPVGGFVRAVGDLPVARTV